MKPNTVIGWAIVGYVTTAMHNLCCGEQMNHQPRTNHQTIPSVFASEPPSVTEIKPVWQADSLYDGYHKLKLDLQGYLPLVDGWAGPGSLAPLKQAIDTATQFVDRLPPGIPLPKPMLSNLGEVGLYWDVGAVYADVNFEEGQLVSLFLRNRNSGHETFAECRFEDLHTSQLKTILAPLALA